MFTMGICAMVYTLMLCHVNTQMWHLVHTEILRRVKVQIWQKLLHHVKTEIGHNVNSETVRIVTTGIWPDVKHRLKINSRIFGN